MVFLRIVQQFTVNYLDRSIAIFLHVFKSYVRFDLTCLILWFRSASGFELLGELLGNLHKLVERDDLLIEAAHGRMEGRVCLKSQVMTFLARAWLRGLLNLRYTLTR